MPKYSMYRDNTCNQFWLGFRDDRGREKWVDLEEPSASAIYCTTIDRHSAAEAWKAATDWLILFKQERYTIVIEALRAIADNGTAAWSADQCAAVAQAAMRKVT